MLNDPLHAHMEPRILHGRMRAEKMTDVARGQMLERSGAHASEPHYGDAEGKRDDERPQRDKLPAWPQVSHGGDPQRHRGYEEPTE
jgi:hypothetical protein